MTDEIERLIATVNEQKGSIIGINALLAAMIRTWPQDDLRRLLKEFDNEVAHARSHLAYAPIPDEVLQGLENYVSMWNAIRVEKNLD